MKITVLDGYGLNPGDLSWEPIAQLGKIDSVSTDFGRRILCTRRRSRYPVDQQNPHHSRTHQPFAGSEIYRHIGYGLQRGRHRSCPQTRDSRFATCGIQYPFGSPNGLRPPVGHYQPRGTLCRRKPQGTLEPQSGLLLSGTRPSWNCPVRKWVSWDSDIPAWLPHA